MLAKAGQLPLSTTDFSMTASVCCSELNDRDKPSTVLIISPLSDEQHPLYAHRDHISFVLNCFLREMYLDNELTSFLKIMLDLVILAHHVCVPDVNSIVLLDLPIAELGVELVGRGVKRVTAWVLLVAVVIIEDRGLADGHTYDRAPVLVCASRAPVAVAALGSQQNRGDVVDLVRGLRAGALLGDAATLAPSVARIQNEGEEEDQEEEGDEASLDQSKRKERMGI